MERNRFRRVAHILGFLAGVMFIVMVFLAESGGMKLLWGIAAALWWFSQGASWVDARRQNR